MCDISWLLASFTLPRILLSGLTLLLQGSHIGSFPSSWLCSYKVDVLLFKIIYQWLLFFQPSESLSLSSITIPSFSVYPILLYFSLMLAFSTSSKSFPLSRMFLRVNFGPMAKTEIYSSDKMIWSDLVIPVWSQFLLTVWGYHIAYILLEGRIMESFLYWFLYALSLVSHSFSVMFSLISLFLASLSIICFLGPRFSPVSSSLTFSSLLRCSHHFCCL